MHNEFSWIIWDFYWRIEKNYERKVTFFSFEKSLNHDKNSNEISSDPWALINTRYKDEFEKVLNYVGERENVTIDDVTKVVVKEIETDVKMRIETL